MHFLQKRRNHRSDEYGGSLENRVRLMREVLEETKEAVGDRCGIAIRLAVEELLGEDGITSGGEGREVVEMLAEMPDLWDVNFANWANDSVSSRFGEEGLQEAHVSFVKSVTSKPVVGVGWFTSPDTMLSQIRRGRARHDRRRPAVHRRSVPAKEDRGRAHGRNPRMHRLQHLRLRPAHVHADALHPEPEHGRGVAARLASGKDRAERVRGTACW